MNMLRFSLLYLAAAAGLLFGQSYQGNFDGASCSSIYGWAWNGTTTPINVDFYDGTVYLTSVLANQDTGSDSYVDGGYHGFSLTTPTSIKDNQIHTIYVRYGGTTVNLGSDPRTIQCDSSSPGYQYYYTDTFQTINTSNWTQNGSLAVLSGWGLSATSSGGGSLISSLAVQGPSTIAYEVNTTLALNTSGGDYVQYLRASSNALTGTGSYFSVELQNPTFNSTTGACTATLATFQSISGTVTQIWSTPVACHNGMQIRTAVTTGNYALITVDGNPYGASFSSTLSSGMPGVGGRSMPSTNAISLGELGPHDAIAPSPINSNTFTPWITQGLVQAEWLGAVDDPNGTGICYYSICRVGGSCFNSVAASIWDGTVQAGTSYTYQISAVDFHSNVSTVTSLTVTTPPANAGNYNPGHRGIRPTNAYWGGAGEQIDMIGGNLNYSAPLITAMGRGGLQATFGLSYNSQNWLTGSGSSAYVEGVDVGYGFGWQLMLGSVMPILGPSGALEYWYTNATGAQFRMTIQNGTVWTGNASFYAWYDTNTNRLNFRDGSFWLMGCVSAGGEPDAGTMYPTLVEDSNGNQIIIHYMPGAGASWIDSSARISTIEDARAVSYTSGQDTLYESYAFSYTTGATGLSYLSSITNYVGTAESYSFTINQGQTLNSPGGVSFGTTSLLAAVTTTGPGYSYNFTYDTTLNDGDLLEAQFPQGGHLRWTYTNCTYAGPQTIREVANRYLLSNAQQGEQTYTFTPGNGTNATLDDPSGAERYWVWVGGWLSEIQYRAYPGATQALRHEYYTWVQDPTSLNYYIGTLKTVLDEGQTYSQTTQTVQTQDSYANVLTSQVSDYGSQSTRTYSNTYLYQNNTNYSSRYIYNRLLTSTLTSASPNIVLAQNTYDAGITSAPNGNPREWDAENYTTSFTYRGNVTTASTPGKTTNAFYDATGTATSQNDNNGHSVSISTSSLTNFTLPDTLSPNGTAALQTQASYATPTLTPASVAGPGQTLYDPNNSPNGTAAYTSYDSYGRIAYTLAPSQSWAAATGAQTNYTYGYATTGWTTTATTTNTGGTSHYTTTTLDGLGRTASVQSGTGTTALSEVDTTYAPCACSPVGKMSQQTQPYAPPNSAPPGTTYTHDGLGRTIKVLLADAASYSTYAYQGNFTTITDPAGNWKQYASDAFGNLVTVLEPDPTANPVPGPPTPSAYPVTSAPTGMLLTSYTYDQFNHLTQAAIPRNTSGGMVTQTRTFVYASTTYSTLALPALWLTSATNPENGTVSYTYNADGTLASKLDANGNTETYTYDAYQRLTAIPTRQQTFTYDTCPTTNNTGCSNAAGQMMQATFGSSTSPIGPNYLSFEYNYAYTPAGKVSTKTLQLQSGNHLNVNNVPASGTVAANYAYDSQGSLVQMSYTPGIYGSGMAVFNYTLDAMERPTAMTTGSHAWASGVTYNAANQMTYDGTQTRTYNSLMQTTQVGNMTYNYSSNKNNGQIASSVDAVTAETITYQYDALKRLLSASGKNWGETYAYDGFGNLLQMNPTGTAGAPSLSVTMDNTTNRVTGSGVAYDSNGNLHYGFAGLTFGYDTANRVTEVMNSTGDYYYAYDSDNRRIYYRDNNNNETIYFYGADGRKTSSYTMTFIGNPNSIQMNPAPGGGNVYFAGILLMEEGSSVRTDRLGSVRWGGPNSLGYQAQYPYGAEYTTTVNDREKYATYTRDSDSGMDYAMNRYYSSQWGRFLSPDRRWRSAKPGNPQSWNRYTYVLGDPINLTDPTGLYYCAPVGNYDPCPPAFGILDGAGDDNDDGDDETPGSGGGCPDSNGGNNFDPTPEPPGPNPCPPPAPPPAPNCDISVAYSGIPRDGQSAVGLPYPYAPPTNQLGPYMNNGWFLYVQVQADLTGDTNGSDWFSSQSASTFGTIRPSPGAPAQILREIQPDDAPYSTVIYSGNGTYDWLDTPGLGKGIYSASLTFSFASTLINTNTRASCSVDWSFQLSVLGNKWSISNIMENSF